MASKWVEFIYNRPMKTTAEHDRLSHFRFHGRDALYLSFNHLYTQYTIFDSIAGLILLYHMDFF